MAIYDSKIDIFVTLSLSAWSNCILNVYKNYMKQYLTQKWSSLNLTHVLNGLKMAKIIIFVTDMFCMVLKSLNKSCMKPHLTQNWSSFILTHILNSIKIANEDPKFAILVTDILSMVLKSVKYIQSCIKPHLAQKFS